jgi:hypothetical protein
MKKVENKNKKMIVILFAAIVISVFAFVISAGLASEKNEDIPVILKSRQFVPTPGIEDGLESKMAALARAGIRRGHVLIQFEHIPTDSEREELKAVGVDLQTYIPENAWFAAIDTDSLLKIGALPFVRWVGEIQVEDKITPHIKDVGVGSWAVNPAGTVNLLVLFFSDVSAHKAKEIIGGYGSVVEEPESGTVWTVTMNESDIVALAGEDAVQWIEEVPPPPTTLTSPTPTPKPSGFGAILALCGLAVAYLVLKRRG